MKKIAIMNTSMRTISIPLVLIFVLIISLFQDRSEVESSTTPNNVPFFNPIATTTLPYQVSGKIEANDAVIIRAQTSGPINSILVTEGSQVMKHELLASQETPVLTNQIALQEAQGVLRQTSDEAQSVYSAHTADRTTVATLTTEENSKLTLSHSQTRVQELSSQLIIGLEEATLNLISILDFIDAHKSSFTGEGLEQYRAVTSALYHGQVSYLSGGVLYPLTSENDILRTLQLEKQKTSHEPSQLIALSELIDSQYSLVQTLLATGERVYLDEKKTSVNSYEYNDYLSKRTSALSSQKNLRSLLSSLTSANDNLSVSTNTNETATTLAQLDRNIAQTQSMYAQKIAHQNTQVSHEQLNLLYSELSLAQSYAPFSGVIAEVFVEQGDYVTPGTPLFSLHGSGSQELVVHVPADMLPFLSIGQQFIADHTLVGFVSRFAPVILDGSIEVHIDITERSYILGEVVVGNILVTSHNTLFQALPRQYVHFDSTQAYVLDEAGEKIKLTIMYDTGDILFVKPEIELTRPLLPSLSIQL